jgi:hypothetical protein
MHSPTVMNKAVTVLGLLATASVAIAQPGTGDTVIIIEPSAPPPAAVQAIEPLPVMMPPSSVPPYVASRATDAPRNEPWNNVSHINGTPVPVGTRNDYLYQFRKTIVSSNPVGWIFGFYGVSVNQALSSNIAIRGDINYMSINGQLGSEVGVGLPIYFRRTYQGPFVEPGLIRRTLTRKRTEYNAAEDRTGVVAGPQVLLGWHWMYESGLNLAVALGAGRDLADSGSDRDIEPFINGYLRIGYAF